MVEDISAQEYAPPGNEQFGGWQSYVKLFGSPITLVKSIFAIVTLSDKPLISTTVSNGVRAVIIAE